MKTVYKCMWCGEDMNIGSHYTTCVITGGHLWTRYVVYEDGEPCDHIGCLHHISHPCERCGRIAGRGRTEIENGEWI